MKKFLIIIIILISTWWAIKPLFHQGYFPMHDDQQIARLFELDQALRGGQIPPRWVSNLGFGYGYPLYNFYPPLVYYVGEIVHLIGFDFITSTKIVMLLGFIFAALAMYLFAKDFLGEKGGILAAILYTYAPYHSVDLFVRGALAEFFSFVFFPLILLTIRNLIIKRSIMNLILFSLSLAGLIITHNLMVIPFGIFLCFYVIFLLFSGDRKGILINIGYIIIGLLTAFGVTAYFSLPAIFEKGYTLVDAILIRELANFRLHFVYLRQFWDSPWGYGGSIPGPYDGMSFQIGKTHILLSIMGGLMALIGVWKKIKHAKEMLLFFIFMIFSVYLISFHSDWIWEFIKPLWYLQFPWRFLSITVLFASLLAAYGIKEIMEKIPNLFIRYSIFFIVIIVIIGLNQGFFHPERYTYFSDKDLTSKENISWKVSKTSFEFIPKGVATTLSDIGTTQLDITKEEIAKANYSIISGQLKVSEVKILPHKKVFKVNAKSEGRLTVNTYNFPGWEAYLDGNKTTIYDQNKLKLITVNIPKENHLLVVEFKNTPIRQIGNILSTITLLILIILAAQRNKIKNYAKKIFS